MLIKNFDRRLVNGSMGKIVRFVDLETYSKSTTETDQVLDESAKPSREENEISTQRWPVVEFITPGGRIEVIITQERWTVQLPNGEIQASRIQVSPSISVASCYIYVYPHKTPDNKASPYTRLGHVYTQVTGPNIGPSQGRSGQSFREG